MQRRHFTSSPRSSLSGSPSRFAALLSRISQAILSPATALKLQHVGGPRGDPAHRPGPPPLTFIRALCARRCQQLRQG